MKRIGWIGFGVLAMSLGASSAFGADLKILPGSTATFIVHARRMMTQETITGVNSNVTGSISANGSAVSAAVSIGAAGFKTADDERDEHVREALKAATSPAIQFTLKSLSSLDAKTIDSKGTTVTAQGKLTVAGQSVDLVFPIVISKEGAKWRVRGSANTSFKALQVSPPGIPVLVSVQDELTVAADLLIGE